MTTSSEPQPATVDGRMARRERGRLAVTNAMIDLVLEGRMPPRPEEVASRAGVSVASLYRYFDTLDDLRDHASERYFERFIHLFEIPDIGVGTLDRRIATLVSARMTLHRTTAPMARLARARALVVHQFDETLRRLNATQADQLRLHFVPELEPLTPSSAEDVVATVATMTSFESWDRFRTDHGRGPAQTKRAWTTALTRILAAP